MTYMRKGRSAIISIGGVIVNTSPFQVSWRDRIFGQRSRVFENGQLVPVSRERWHEMRKSFRVK